ncbi:AraC family transcriptional regulator [Sinomicrobium pectinilyticum]|uniref:AraC family transcriptional regulator n=1 Tax=Sinomicrobium pectinilyticum TaxID=1084421 RepID=A0A3N0EHU4_SINP1|nr:AraC family transcriptional regulator [Sinomicrobium pectinilyticum]RNL87249.1 AraC family transcriptional regulator [Sinomicrobium pectinilyticum]
MKTPLIIESKQTGILEALAAYSNEEISRTKNEKMLSYNNQVGKIRIKESVIKKGLVFSHYRVCFNQDTTYKVFTEEKRCFLFAYSVKGQLFHKISSLGNKEEHLDEFQTEILHIKAENILQYHFKEKQPYDFFVICLYDIDLLRSRLKQETSPDGKETFRSFLNKTHTYNYIGSYNLMIADYARRLRHIAITDLSKHLLFEGIVNIIISLKIQQFIEDERNKEKTAGSLNKRECREIHKLSEFIYENPEKQYTVEYLCSISGLAPCKLQEGFKEMHNRTVADFIRNVRVEKAERLISSTDLNISEVVYSIGFASRSYFSKIFKRKYNCSPKFYQKNKSRMAEVNGAI